MKTNPLYLPSQTWSGTVELDCGDLGFKEVDARIIYSQQDGRFYLTDVQAFYFHKAETPVGELTLKIDLTSLLSDSTKSMIFDEYVVKHYQL